MSICPKCGYIEPSKQRSTQQNRAYFKIVVTTLAEFSNCSKEAMHSALAGEFLGYDIITLPSGDTRSIPKSTSRLTTKEFCEYYEKIQRYCSENGFDIRSPNEIPIKDN